MQDVTSGRAQARSQLKQQLRTATSRTTWLEAALALDRLEASASSSAARARMSWENNLYDRALLTTRMAHLAATRAGGDILETMHALRSDLLRNFGGITNPVLHESLPTVPLPIKDYIIEVQACMDAVASAPPDRLPLEEKLGFLKETRHAFGRTALVLSGGGSFGAFHIGVVSALMEAKLLPRVISGSSAGAIVAAIVCTRSDAELQAQIASISEVDPADFLSPTAQLAFYSSNTAAEVLRHLIKKGTLQDSTVLAEKLKGLLGDTTFYEAHQRSGRILNISVTAADTKEPPRLLNYLTAPNVLIWSAVVCSSAFPFLYAPSHLFARDARGQTVSFSSAGASTSINAGGGTEVNGQRRWRDGSLEEDLPMRGLSEMFSVNYFLVSQANPYLLPVLALKRAAPRLLGTLVEGEFKHRCKQLMDLLPNWIGASRLLKLLNQPWEGDVTMVLPASSLSLGKALINLTKADFLRALEEGKRRAWAKQSSIQANCAVEVTIDDCLSRVVAQARTQNAKAVAARRSSSGARLVNFIPPSHSLGNLKNAIPSWIHMPAYAYGTGGTGIGNLSRPESMEKLHPMMMPSNGYNNKSSSSVGDGGGGTPTSAAAAAAGNSIGSHIGEEPLISSSVPEEAELDTLVELMQLQSNISLRDGIGHRNAAYNSAALSQNANEGGGGGGEHHCVRDGTVQGEDEEKEEPYTADEAEGAEEGDDNDNEEDGTTTINMRRRRSSKRKTAGMGTATGTDALTSTSPSFHTNANAWRDYFGLAPATTETRRRPTLSTSASRSGLDFFAY
jgi:TAG lipase / steryl ester hydrolase / phospholipase A2 / LPA acyltransferase